MNLFKWFKLPGASHKGSQRGSKSVFRPCVEGLEARWTPTVTLYENGLIAVHGANAANEITVFDNQEQDAFVIREGEDTFLFKSSEVRTITIYTGDSNDVVEYFVQGNKFTYAKDIFVTTYGGTDTVRVDIGNEDIVIKDDIRVGIITGNGVDNSFVAFSATDEVNIEVSTDMGLGDDYSAVYFMGALEDNTNVFVDMRGSFGDDIMHVGASVSDMDGNGDFNLNMFGEQDNDTLSFIYEGEMDGDMNVVLDGGIGDDTVDSSATFNLGSSGNVRLDTFGRQGNDTVSNVIFDFSGPNHTLNVISKQNDSTSTFEPPTDWNLDDLDVVFTQTTDSWSTDLLDTPLGSSSLDGSLSTNALGVSFGFDR